MMAHPLALQLRNLQSLVEIGVDKNTTVVFPAPLMSTIAELGSFLRRESEAAAEHRTRTSANHLTPSSLSGSRSCHVRYAPVRCRLPGSEGCAKARRALRYCSKVTESEPVDPRPGRRPRTVSACVVSLALVAALTAGCAASSTGPIAVTGTVDDDLLTVATPLIGAVAPNPNAGFSPYHSRRKRPPPPLPTDHLGRSGGDAGAAGRCPRTH